MISKPEQNIPRFIIYNAAATNDLKENKEGQYMFSESLARAAGKGGQTRAEHNEIETEKSSKYVAGGHFKDPDTESESDSTRVVEPGELI